MITTVKNIESHLSNKNRENAKYKAFKIVDRLEPNTAKRVMIGMAMSQHRNSTQWGESHEGDKALYS